MSEDSSTEGRSISDFDVFDPEGLESALVPLAKEEHVVEYRHSQDSPLSPELSVFSGCSSWIPGAEYTQNDPLFLHAFVNGFIPAVSPQHCHPLLSPMTIFMAQGIMDPMMREVIYACGAAFLTNENKGMLTEAKKRYANCLILFANRLSATGGEIQEWMVAAALLFTLRDKILQVSPEHPTRHLSKAIELLRALRRSIGDNSITLKFFVDSFLFNYSVTFLTTGPLAVKILPSPYEVFDEWRPIYENQLFKCFAPWMNNPVLGAATNAFELTAKSSWLISRAPLQDLEMVLACELLAKTYETALLPPLPSDRPDDLSGREYQYLQDSVAVDEAGKIASQILLLRLMNPTLELSHDIVQSRVRRVLSVLDTISPTTSLWVICPWLLLITGLCAETLADRKSIVEKCKRAGHMGRGTEFMVRVDPILKESWGTEENPGRGWDTLFDSAALRNLCL